ncbi:hypothetical protein [Amycolatopsis sp. NPDC057786]|uniref:hypothetical protein n=1 Tax=Amycolatopsis sp. NPDC057786 TaxID=3346250 RepID=UPI00366B4451
MINGARPGRHGGLYFCWHRSQYDGLDHAVTDEEFFRARKDDSRGRYAALCGHVVLAAPMLVPNGRPCKDCRAFVRAWSAARTVRHRQRPTRHRAPAGWRRLARKCSRATPRTQN